MAPFTLTPDQQLEFLRSANTPEIAKYLATRVRAERLRHGYSQVSFAEKAGVAVRTYKRFELCGDGSIETLIRVLMALDHARGFFTLFPQAPVSGQRALAERVREIGQREISKKDIDSATASDRRPGSSESTNPGAHRD